MTQDPYRNYKYFHGEEECPFTDFGRQCWWRIESSAFKYGDTKYKDCLSGNMVDYILNRHWENESNMPTITKEECIRCAYQLYKKGLWSSSYLSIKEVTMQDVIKQNQ